MTITNEIQIHDAIGNATLIGGQAIRLRLNLNSHSPNIAGYHLYNASSQLITILPDYNLALTTAQIQSLIVVWRNDLDITSNSAGYLARSTCHNRLLRFLLQDLITS